MTAPASQVSFGGVALSGYCTLGVGGLRISYEKAAEGWSDLVMSTGAIVRQSFFDKKNIVISGAGSIPPELRSMALTTVKELIVPDPEEEGGTKTYSVWASYSEDNSPNSLDGRVSWTLTCREE